MLRLAPPVLSIYSADVGLELPCEAGIDLRSSAMVETKHSAEALDAVLSIYTVDRYFGSTNDR